MEAEVAFCIFPLPSSATLSHPSSGRAFCVARHGADITRDGDRAHSQSRRRSIRELGLSLALVGNSRSPRVRPYQPQKSQIESEPGALFFAGLCSSWRVTVATLWPLPVACAVILMISAADASAPPLCRENFDAGVIVRVVSR